MTLLCNASLQMWLECARVWTKPPASPPSPTERCPRGPSISWTCLGSWWRSRCGGRRWGSLSQECLLLFSLFNHPGEDGDYICWQDKWTALQQLILPVAQRDCRVCHHPPTHWQGTACSLFIYLTDFSSETCWGTQDVSLRGKKRMAVL